MSKHRLSMSTLENQKQQVLIDLRMRIDTRMSVRILKLSCLQTYVDSPEHTDEYVNAYIRKYIVEGNNARSLSVWGARLHRMLVGLFSK